MDGAILSVFPLELIPQAAVAGTAAQGAESLNESLLL